MGSPGRRRLAELDVGFVDRHGRFEPFLVKRAAVGRQVTRRRQPQAAAVGQLDQLLLRGAADRVLADELGALVPEQGRRQTVPRRPTCRCRSAATVGSVIAPSPARGGDRFLRRALRLAHRQRALADEEPREREAGVERSAGSAADVDDESSTRRL